jgi:Trk K+ transport system NAD-binding subunit
VASLSALPLPAWLSRTEAHWSDDYRVIAVPVPRGWAGRTLREIDCRTRYGVAVLAVHSGGEERTPGYALPDPDRPLAAGDTLVLAGAPERLRLAQAA